MRLIFIISVLLVLTGCGRSVLPSKRTIMQLTEAELRTIVISHAPLGSSHAAVEDALTHKFRRKWDVRNYEAANLISQRGLSVQVVNGDYYLSGDFAVVLTSPFTSSIMTVYFLFDSRRQLKDVAVRKWADGW